MTQQLRVSLVTDGPLTPNLVRISFVVNVMHIVEIQIRQSTVTGIELILLYLVVMTA